MNGSFEIENKGRFEGLSNESLVGLVLEKEFSITLLKKELIKLLTEKADAAKNSTDDVLWLNEQIAELIRNQFHTSSEKEKPMDPASLGEALDSAETSSSGSGRSDDPLNPKAPASTQGRVKLPSLKYPNLPIVEKHITLGSSEKCSCCGNELVDTELTEDSEKLSREPAKYFVEVQKRHKYICKSRCQEGLTTAKNPARVLPGSSLSDDLIVNAALDKYCDLLPITRQIKIAERLGVDGLHSGTLNTNIQTLGEFVSPVVSLIEDEVFSSPFLSADETPHKMLEGSEKKNWYLWGFSSSIAAFFLAKDTRSGDVAIEFLLDSNCEYLMSDVYTGYGRAVREVNVIRAKMNQPLIQCLYCNAHARRYFKKAKDGGCNDAKFFIAIYQQIYLLDQECKTEGKTREQILELRHQMRPYFEKMKVRAFELKVSYSAKSKMQKAIDYFLNHYEGFIRFLKIPEMPIDNNQQERLIRNPVVGRKTWYGTHSEQGARTMSIFFTIIETCRLNRVNPRIYFKILIEAMLAGEPAFTPNEYFQRMQKTA